MGEYKGNWWGAAIQRGGLPLAEDTGFFPLPSDDPAVPMEDHSKDIAMIGGIAAIPTMLDVVCRMTGMGFAAVARVTESRWIACSVLDRIQFGLEAGGELEIESTICHEIRQVQEPVIIDHVAEDSSYHDHHTPRMYGFQSYISVPIFLPDKRFFGTLCAIDPNPAKLNTPEVIGMFRLFSELISFHIDAAERLAATQFKLIEAQEASRLREQFIAVLGHDLKNPLTAVSMGTALLKEGGLDERSGQLVEMMAEGASRMSDLIDDVMDFTRGRLSGGIPLEEVSDCPVQPVLDQVLSEIRTAWPGREIKLDCVLEEPVFHDPKRMGQLFSNLLTNAVHYGDSGVPVVVRASSGSGRFELSVSNASSPIPPETIRRLFEPFSRGESGGNRQGLGLGLYIASQIAKSHDGTLEVNSTEEETRFTFSMRSGAWFRR